MIPTFILTMWLLGLLSVAFVSGAVYLGHEWYMRSWGWDEALQQSVFAPDLGWNQPTALLAGAVLLGVIAVAGGPILKGVLRLIRRRGDDPRRALMAPTSEQRLRRPDGSELLIRTYLTIALSPLVWLMNWLSYWNGSAHLSSMRGSFAGTESWEQIDFSARFTVLAPPAVLARGMLGMLRYDATATLLTIKVPTLVVAGDRDSTCLPEASERMRYDIPGARLVTLSPSKHLGLIEHHVTYAQAVQDFAQPLKRHAAEAIFA